MIIVAGVMDVDPSERDDFLKGRRDGVLATHAEDGCIEYAFSADLVEPGRIRIFERWESKEALAVHLAGMAGRPPASPPVEILHRELLQYEISSIGPLGS